VTACRRFASTVAKLDALRVELWIDVLNEPSKRVAERCGYVREGVLRSVYFKQGRRQRFRDLVAPAD
jgi:RimJ/RimL family protein N-acetyltransferase